MTGFHNRQDKKYKETEFNQYKYVGGRRESERHIKCGTNRISQTSGYGGVGEGGAEDDSEIPGLGNREGRNASNHIRRN